MSESRPRPYRARSRKASELSEWIVSNFRQVAESPEQGFINRTLLSSLERLIRQRGWTRVFAGSDTFVAWSKGDPKRRVSPDVYLVDDPPAEIPTVWCTWLPDHSPPRFAVEVVSKDWLKDYVLDPAKYAELGCKELVIFDPHATRRATGIRQRVPLTVFQRSAEGRLEKVYAGEGPARSLQLDLWLIPRRADYWPTLRLSEDQAGTRIVLTADESAEAKERELARREAEPESLKRALDLQKADFEREFARREAAHDREVRLLKAQLQKAQAETATKPPRRSRKPKPGGK